MADKTGGKGNKKKGRQKKSYQNMRYINEQRHAKSHIRRMTKHLAQPKHANDKAAAEALKLAKIGVKGYA